MSTPQPTIRAILSGQDGRLTAIEQQVETLTATDIAQLMEDVATLKTDVASIKAVTDGIAGLASAIQQLLLNVSGSLG